MPSPLRAVLGRMLALAPDERPGDPEKLASELRHAALALAGTESQPARSSRARTLSGDEQRMTAVVVISGISGAGEDPAALASLAATLRARGAKLDRTSEGLWIVALVGRGVPGDAAAHAARLALRVRATFPGAKVAIATGRISEDEAALAGAVERASRLLPAAPADTVCVDDRPLACWKVDSRWSLSPRVRSVCASNGTCARFRKP